MRDGELAQEQEHIRRWYAVAVHTSREATAAEGLAERDFEVLLPPWLIQRTGYQNGASRAQRRLFPGYLFLHTPARARWKLLAESPCVIGVVCAGTTPAPARAGAVEALQRLAMDGDGEVWQDAEGLLHPAPLPPRRSLRALRQAAVPFQPGDRVRVEDGVFRDYEGTYRRYRGGVDEGLELDLDIDGRTKLAVVPAALLRAA